MLINVKLFAPILARTLRSTLILFLTKVVSTIRRELLIKLDKSILQMFSVYFLKVETFFKAPCFLTLYLSYICCLSFL